MANENNVENDFEQRDPYDPLATEIQEAMKRMPKVATISETMNYLGIE